MDPTRRLKPLPDGFRENECSAVGNVSSWSFGEEGKETYQCPHAPHEKDRAGVQYVSPRLVNLCLAVAAMTHR